MIHVCTFHAQRRLKGTSCEPHQTRSGARTNVILLLSCLLDVDSTDDSNPLESTARSEPNKTIPRYGMWSRMRAQKQLKGVTRNFIRLRVLSEALVYVSVAFMYDLYWPQRSKGIPSWAWIPSVITWGCTVGVMVARVTPASFRRQAVVLRTRELAMWLGRTPRPWIYVAGMAACLSVGVYFAYPFASSIGGSVGLSVHYLALLASVSAVSFVSLGFYESTLRT